eukprot:1052516-Amphidinium_carterae.1
MGQTTLRAQSQVIDGLVHVPNYDSSTAMDKASTKASSKHYSHNRVLQRSLVDDGTTEINIKSHGKTQPTTLKTYCPARAKPE